MKPDAQGMPLEVTSPIDSSFAARSGWALQLLGSKWALRIVSLSLLMGVWELGGRLDRTLLFPPLSRVVAAFWQLLISGELLAGFAVSLQAFVIGFGLAIAVGIFIGLVMGRLRPVERFFNPYLDILLAAPTIAFIPLFVVWFGLGLTSRVGVIFIFSVVIIAVNTHTGVRGVDPQLVEMGRAFGLREDQLFWKIILPAAMPLIMGGIRLGAGRAFVGMVAADILLVSVGIGGVIQYYNATFKTASLFAAVLAVIMLAVGLIELTRAVERRATAWR
ncbi:MAG: ABC transporter permease [Anaerolineae bacterium]